MQAAAIQACDPTPLTCLKRFIGGAILSINGGCALVRFVVGAVFCLMCRVIIGAQIDPLGRYRTGSNKNGQELYRYLVLWAYCSLLLSCCMVVLKLAQFLRYFLAGFAVAEEAKGG